MTPKFSASAAGRMMACPGSANLDLAIPGWTPPVEDPTKFKAKGVGDLVHTILEPLAHWGPELLVFTELQVLMFSKLGFVKRRELCDDITEMILWLNPFWPTGVPDSVKSTVAVWFTDLRPLAPKMLRFISDVAKALEGMKNSFSYSGRVLIRSEWSMEVTWIQSKGVRTTADLVMYEADSAVLEVVDYKSGSIPVEVIDNVQLLYYARTVLDQLTKEGKTIPKRLLIRLRIMQPDNFVEHVVSLDELLEWAETALLAEDRVLKEVTSLIPGDHCTFCPANPFARGERGYPLCPAKREQLFPSTIDIDEMLS